MTPISELAQRIVKIVDDEGYYDSEAAGAEVDQYVLTPIRECFDVLLMGRRPDRSPCWCLVGPSDIRIAAGQPEHTEACQRVRELYPKLEIGTSSIATPVAATGDDEGELAEVRKKATQYFRWAYQLLLALAKRRLADANAENEARGEPDTWPAGQQWHEMVGSSHSIFLRGARAEAKISEDAFMGTIRSSEVDVDDLYAAALRTPESK